MILNSQIKKKIQLILVGISSILLGVWAVKGVIAFRHTLLCLGFMAAILYAHEQKHFFKKISIKAYIPLLLIGLIFFWVVFHFLFLTKYPEEQLKELSGTWMRAFIAALIGITTGQALGDMLKNNWFNQYKLIFFGIITTTIIYYFQYIINVIEYKKIFIPIYDEYIYRGKLNIVLMSSILVAYVLGIKEIVNSRIYTRWTIILLAVITYSYVYIANSKIGLILIFILIIFNYIEKIIKNKFSIGILLFALVGLAYLQGSHNHGWATLLEDSRAGWYSSPEKAIFNNGIAPILESGNISDSSTYQRAFLIHLGLRLVSQNIYGIGVSKGPLKLLINCENKCPSSTHSGLLDLTIAFGLPILVLIILLISYLTYGIYKSNYKNINNVAFNILIVVVFLYTIGELGDSHAVEILMYLLGTVSGFYIISYSKISNEKQ